ncbi:Zinc/cadmium resistance protein [Yarrowia sp. C11]|nr:Zinc/cadmium resistance protein [Yarrowia sp. C11]KAG5365071.1 Zinc/cadmium resistance protein [Yarrowia sp. E02]
MSLTSREIRMIALLIIDTCFFLLEAIVGYAVHSLALVADSFHMLNDVFSLIIALWAVRVAKSRGADSKYTYGWQRAEILGALANAVFLLALCLTILLEAIQRLFEPQVITNPKLIAVVGTAGLCSNIVGLLLFHEHGHAGHSHGHDHGHDHDHAHDEEEAVDNVLASQFTAPTEQTSLLQHPTSHRRSISNIDSSEHATHFHAKKKNEKKKQVSLNMQGVFLHVMGDALGNIGVIATAFFIWKTDYSWKYYADPVISLVITVIIFSSALPLCRSTSSILLQAVPQNINAEDVKNDIVALDGVEELHDLHIWILKEDTFVATLHVGVASDPSEFMTLSNEIKKIFHEHGINSVTIQPEFNVATGSTTPDKHQYHVSVGGLRSANSNGCLAPQ